MSDSATAAGQVPARFVDLMTVAARVLEQTSAPRIVLVGERRPLLVKLLRLAYPGSVVTSHPESVPEELHLTMATEGPYDLLIDIGSQAGKYDRFRAIFFHTRRGGSFVTALGPRGLESKGRLAWLARRLQAALATGDRPPEPGLPLTSDNRTRTERDFDALAWSISQLREDDGHLVVTNRASALPILREDDANRVLGHLQPPAAVLETLPATTLVSRSQLRRSAGVLRPEPPSTYDAPELSLRTYRDVVCHPHQIVVSGRVVLPETYRQNMRPRLRNRELVGLAPSFVQDLGGPAGELSGTWFHLDNECRGHFGHAMTEQISRLWGWKRAKERYPDARALVFQNRERGIAQWEYDLFAAGGIDPEDLWMAEDPVRVEHLVTASPMFSLPDFVHPGIEETWREIGVALDARSTLTQTPRRIFCSRRIDKRNCHNAAELEGLFAAHGFEVIFPEDHSLPDQVRIFRGAEVIAGYAGSGMYQIAFTERPRHLILVTSESYTAHNEHLMAAVLGHRVDLVLCEPDVAQPEQGWSRAAFRSDFTFDPAREGVFLREVLAGLDR
ncbi:glycosyltransferase family 61 protein [Nocardioides sp.]|uniref:glycosyltransferase family 61 protein n=1 Tax=Nocardioides sp. TaxID=35761 RepID=UPI003D150F2B